MMKVFLSILATISLVSCSHDPVARASEDAWSSKQQSIKTVEEISKKPKVPMIVDGDTVRQSALSILTQASDSTNPILRANPMYYKSL